jgi:peroxiredoxin
MRQQPAYLKSLLVGVVLVVGLAMASVALALDVGDPAPDFTLPSTTGEKISLSQFKGKKHVLIQFYRVDFNPV